MSDVDRPRERSWLALVLAAAGALALGIVAVLAFAERAGPGTSSGSAPPTPTTSAPSPGPCIDDTAVVPALAGTKAGRYMATSLDRVAVEGGNGRWDVRFFVGPGDGRAPGPASVPLDATLDGADGSVPVVGYSAGPPSGPFTAASDRVTVQPCRPVVLRITTTRVPEGAFTLRLRGVGLPEGGTMDLPHRGRLVCEAVPTGGSECRNPAGTVGPSTVPTSSPGTAASPQPGFAAIQGRVGYPAGFRPALTVYAIDVTDARRYHSVQVAGDPTGQTGTGRYTLSVWPGTYHVVAYLTDATARPSNPGIYSRYVLCGLRAQCTDHTLVEVAVAAGETRTGIDPTDWYYPEGTRYPPRPE